MDKHFLGEFEQMVLLATLRLGSEAYAVPIREEIERQASRQVSRGALYTTLERLENKGMLESRIGDAVDDRGGRPRRYYTLTAAARGALRESREAMANLWRGLERAVER